MNLSPVYARHLPLAGVLVLLAACEPAAETNVADGREPPETTYAPGGIEHPPVSEGTGVGDLNPDVGARTASVSTATANLKPASDSGVGGTLAFAQRNGYVRITGEITGLAPGLHGLHVHEIGDCSAPDASSAGGHYAPHGAQHGAPTQTDDLHHAGDLGNIVADSDGKASVDAIDDSLTLSGPETIIGRAIVVHAGADDLVSQPAGDSGDRVACGVIDSGAAVTG